MRVLVVDDDQETCGVLVDLLESEGMDAQSCLSGEDGPRALAALTTP
jgi:CheY-like chemotaxis protein